jgi:hypothetical protein
MDGHYRKVFADTLIKVQRLSVSTAVFTVTENRNNINSHKMTTRCRAVVRMMIDELKNDVTILSRDSDQYRLKRMQLALYVLLSQALSIQSPNERYKELKNMYYFMDRLKTTTFDEWKNFLITGSTEFFDNRF